MRRASYFELGHFLSIVSDYNRLTITDLYPQTLVCLALFELVSDIRNSENNKTTFLPCTVFQA